MPFIFDGDVLLCSGFLCVIPETETRKAQEVFPRQWVHVDDVIRVSYEIVRQKTSLEINLKLQLGLSCVFGL